jgi:hypothetical protein
MCCFTAGLQLQALGRAATPVASIAFQQSALLLHSRPALWLRLAQCALSYVSAAPENSRGKSEADALFQAYYKIAAQSLPAGSGAAAAAAAGANGLESATHSAAAADSKAKDR